MTEATTVIVGAGQAGSEAALALRKLGYQGRILLVGREEQTPYERPPLSKKLLLGTLSPERLQLRAPSVYEGQGIELRLGRRVAALAPAERRLYLAGGEVLRYEHCILATGAEPRRLSVPGADLPGVHLLRSLADALALKEDLRPGRRLLVIGAGYLGLEAAASARRLGLAVTVVEAGSAVLRRGVSRRTAGAFADLHRRNGVSLITGATVAALEGARRVEAARLADGTRLPADVVLVAIGVTPESAVAEAAGIACDNGIITDAACRTSAEGVLAIGDCANHYLPFYGRHLRLESVQGAVGQAQTAAATLLGRPAPARRAPYFWSDQYEQRLQIAGLPDESEACEERLEGDLAGAFALYRESNGRLLSVEAVNRPADFVRAQRLIGEEMNRGGVAAGESSCPR